MAAGRSFTELVASNPKIEAVIVFHAPCIIKSTGRNKPCAPHVAGVVCEDGERVGNVDMTTWFLRIRLKMRGTAAASARLFIAPRYRDAPRVGIIASVFAMEPFHV
jgi:hypothetical protein